MSTTKRNYPSKLKSYKNENFKLVDMSYEDYSNYCEALSLPKIKASSKKQFFTEALNQVLLKKDNQLYRNGELLVCKK